MLNSEQLVRKIYKELENFGEVWFESGTPWFNQTLCIYPKNKREAMYKFICRIAEKLPATSYIWTNGRTIEIDCIGCRCLEVKAYRNKELDAEAIFIDLNPIY